MEKLSEGGSQISDEEFRRTSDVLLSIVKAVRTLPLEQYLTRLGRADLAVTLKSVDGELGKNAKSMTQVRKVAEKAKEIQEMFP